MSEEQVQPPQQGQISRRTLAKGVAWAVPAVAVASAAPAYAVSATTTTTVAQCIDAIENSGTFWDVGAQYGVCGMCNDHMDVRLKFNVTAINCPYEKVIVRVRNYPNGGTANAKWCWSGTNGWLRKEATVANGVVTYPNQVITPSITRSDGLYFPAYSTDGKRDNLGGCQGDYEGGVNDGMHINPCSPGPYFEYEISYDEGDTWPVTGTWGSQTPGASDYVPNPCVAPVLTLDSSTCTNNRRTVTVSWTGSANRLQRRTGTSGSWWTADIVSVSGNSHTYSFDVNNCNTTYSFRVYQNNSTNYSNVVNTPPLGRQAEQPEEQPEPVEQQESQDSVEQQSSAPTGGESVDPSSSESIASPEGELATSSGAEAAATPAAES